MFVTFEESPDDIRTNMLSFGWDLAALGGGGEAGPSSMPRRIRGGDRSRPASSTSGRCWRASSTRCARSSAGARRLVDSTRSPSSRSSRTSPSCGASCSGSPRRSKAWVSRRCSPPSAPRTTGRSRGFGVEEFIADNVMILRNVLEDESGGARIEILKFRGSDHQKGEYPFTIVPTGGRDRDPARRRCTLEHESRPTSASRPATRSSTRCAAVASSATRSCSSPARRARARR